MSFFSSKHISIWDIRPIKVVALYLTITIIWFGVKNHLGESALEVAGQPFILPEMAIDIFFMLIISAGLLLGTRRQLNYQVTAKFQYKNLFLSNPTPMFIFDAETLQILKVNNAAVQTYGYNVAEFTRLTALDLVSNEYKIMGKVDVQTVLSSFKSSSFHHQHLKKDGAIISAKVIAYQIHFQNRTCVFAISENVTLQLLQQNALTQLHQAEELYKKELESKIEQLKHTLEEKERLAEVIDRIHNIVIIVDIAGIIMWVNQAFIDTTGYSFNEAVGKTNRLLDGPQTDPAIQNKAMETILEDEFTTFEIVNYSKNGRGYWVEVTITPIFNDQKEVVRYISIQNIITGRKLRDLQIVEQNEVLKKLAWTNSHSVRKPVASILGLVELSRGMEDMEELKALHALIGQCSIELDSVTKEVSAEINGHNLDGFTAV
jgi:PAS domain S-box-containing protein